MEKEKEENRRKVIQIKNIFKKWKEKVGNEEKK